MKFNKLYLMFAAGVLGVVPAVAADAAPAAPAPKAEAPKAAPKAEAPKAEAPKVDVWSKIPEVVATVDGKPVTKAELIAHVKSQFPNGELPPQVTPEIIAQNAPEMVREMIAERLFKADFEARKPTVSKEEARKFLQEYFKNMPPQQRQMFTQMLAQQGKTVDQMIEAQISAPGAQDKIARSVFMRNVILKDTDATDAEAKKFYDDHIAEVPKVIEASHILVQVMPDADEAAKKAALAKINAIAEELKKNPAAFEAIAKEKSDDPGTKARGGKLVFRRGGVVPEFEKAALALKKGEISGVVKTQYGYHIIRCDAPEASIAFETVKNSIKQMLKSEKVERAINAYVDGLMKQNKVVILVKAPALPAPAQAPAAPAADKPAAKPAPKTDKPAAK